jgi:hypothetical protein
MKQSSNVPCSQFHLLSVLHIYQAPHGTHCHYTCMFNRTSCIAHLTNSLLAAFLHCCSTGQAAGSLKPHTSPRDVVLSLLEGSLFTLLSYTPALQMT